MAATTPRAEPSSGALLREAWRLWPRSRSLRVLLLLAVGWFLLISAQQLGQPYVIDEAEFPFIAEQASRSGLPIYYHGELRPADVGIFHPPLYVYALAGWIQAFGDSHAAVRSFGVVCALATATLVAATARLIAPARHDLLGVLAVAAYLLNPLVIASGLLPDIDGTLGVLTVTAGLHLLAAVVVAARPARWEAFAVGAAFGLALSTKLTTPLAFLPLMLVSYAASRRSLVAAGRDWAVSVAVGVTLFLSWWGTLAAATTLSFVFPFQFTLDSLTSKGGSAGLSERVAALRPSPMTLFWLDPLLLLLTLVVGVGALVAWRNPRARAVALLAVFSLGTVALYDVITTPVFRFPKYWIAAVPAAVIVAVVALGWALHESRAVWRARWAPPLLGVLLVAAFGLATVYVHRAVEVTPNLAPLRHPLGSAAAVLALGALVAACARPGGRVDVRALIALPVVGGLLLAVGLHGASLASVQRSADYSTRYYYGERGFDQTVDDLRRLTPDRDPVLAPKDIGYEADRPFHEDALYLPDTARLRTLLTDGTVEFAVTRKDYDYSEQVWPEAFVVIRELMEPIVQRPDTGFVIWRLKETA